MTRDTDKAGTTGGAGGAGGAKVGYGSPPVEHRFRKGVCPNPAGRPKGSGKARADLPHFYDEPVAFTEGGKRSKVPRGELLIRKLEKLARDGCSTSASLLLDLKRKVDRARAGSAFDACVTTGNVWDPARPAFTAEDILRGLGMVTKLYPSCRTARMMIEPWLVQAALARLGDRRFTREQQEEIVRSTRCPHHVDWPDWWDADLRGTKRQNRRTPAHQGQDRD